MNRWAWRTWRAAGAGALLALWMPAGTAHAAPPRLVSASVDDADAGIDPTVAELRFEFDQPMEPGSFSICGGGETFPKLQGRPEWRDDRTLVVQVRLEASHEYALSLNCGSAHGFRNQRGEVLDPYPIRFRTAPSTEAAAAEQGLLDDAAIDSVFASLSKAIQDRYSYRDRLKIDWEHEIARARGEVRAPVSRAACARRIAGLLSLAQDAHAGVRVNGFVLGTFHRKIEPNSDPRTLARVVPGIKPIGPGNSPVAMGRFEDGVVYAAIASWSISDPAVIDGLVEQLSGEAGAPGFVIDVRSNGGGDELQARRVASLFLRRPTVYSTNTIRDPQAASPTAGPGWAGPFERVVGSVETTPGPLAGKRVAVLIGPVCVSSCESFILMMRHGAAARLFGATTFGSSGNPKAHDLGHGISVTLPSWIDMDVDGTPIEGRGIRPDVEIPWPSAGARTGDPILDAAVAWVRSK